MTSESGPSWTVKASVIVACLVLAFASPCVGQHFYFAQMTDLHIGKADNAERVAKVVDSINRLPMKIECVVVTGDILDAGMSDEPAVKATLETMSKLKPPVHYLAGNHDIVAGDRMAQTAEAFARNFGPLASKADYRGVTFLMLYSETAASQRHIPNYDALKWLEQHVAEAGDKPVIVFTHRPDVEDLNAGFASDGGSLFFEWRKESRDKWDSIVKSPSVKAVITGHRHRDQLHWVGCTPVYVCPPVTGLFGRQTTYRVYEYTDGRLGYWTVYLN